MKDNVRIAIQLDETEGHDFPVELNIKQDELDLNNRYFRLVEEDQDGNILDDACPFQLDETDDGSVSLTFMVKGVTQPNQTRCYALVATDHAPDFAPLNQNIVRRKLGK